MTLDVIVAFLFGVLTFLGWRSGALGQVLRLAAAAIVLIAGPIAAVLVRQVLFGESGLAEPLVEVASYFLGATLLYVAVVGAGWLTIRAMRAASKTLDTMDRSIGAGIGAVKATLLVYVVVCGALLLAVPLQKMDPDDKLHLRNGYTTEFAEQYDVLSPWRMPELTRLHRLVAAGARATEHDALDVVRGHANAADLLRRDDVRTLTEDAAFLELVGNDQWAHSVADGRVRELLNDSDFVDDLGQVDLDDLESDLDAKLGREPSRSKPETPEVAPSKSGTDSGEKSPSAP